MKQRLLLLPVLLFAAFMYGQNTGRQSENLNRVSGNDHLFTSIKPDVNVQQNTHRPAPPTNVGLPMACVTGTLYPTAVWTPVLTGATELITGSAWPGEYSLITVSTGNQYTFWTSVTTDYVTITTTAGTVLAEGTGTVTWNNTNVTGNVRYYIHLNANCGTVNTSRNRYISALPSVCNVPTGVTVSNVGPHSATFSWNAVLGSQVQGYQIVYTSSTGVSPDDNYPVTITNDSATTSTYQSNFTEGTTYYHWIRTVCANGNSSWVPFQFTTTPATGCTTFSYTQWPTTTFTPSCTGTSEDVTTNGYAGEYSMVAAVASRRYTFNSSVATDMITVTNAAGTTVYATGYSPLVWNSGTLSGNIRFYTHTNANCGTEAVDRTRSITCETVSCASPSDFVFSNIGTTTATVAWTANTPLPTSYQYRFTNTLNPVPYDNLSTDLGLMDTPGFSIIDATPNTVYYFYVRSICGDIPGPWVYGGTFTTNSVGCITAQQGLYPTETFTPSCTGSNETITNLAWAGEYSNVNVIANTQYTFSSSDTGDFITITNAAGTTVLASGATPLQWTPTSTATIRYILHASSNCDVETISRSRYIKCGGCNTPAPTATALSFCGSATVANLTATGANLKWYIDNTSTTVLNSTTVIFTRTYYVSQTINGCESPRVAVPVTVTNTPAPTAPDFNLCSGATVANLTATGTNIKWYSNITGGSPLASTVVLTGGTYFVSQTVNGCESTRNAIFVNINSTAAPTASAQTFCGTTTVASLSATGTNLKWYLASTGGTQLSTSTQISTRTYFVSQTVNGCESSRTAVSVTVNTIAAPTSQDVTLCNGSTVANLVATGTNIKWYNVDFGGTPLTPSSQLYTGYFFATQTINGCESSRAVVYVTIITPPAPVIEFTETSCTGNTGTINIVSPRGTGITYSINGGNSYQTSPLFSNLGAGSYIILYKNATGCVSEIYQGGIYASSAPAAPTVTPVQPTCIVATGTITATAPTGTGFTYSINGTAYQASATFANVLPGTYNVTVKNAAGCVSAATSVTINAAPATPTAPVVAFTGTSCVGNTGTITVMSPLGAGITYSINGGNSYQSSPAFANLAAGSYTVYYKTAAGCRSVAFVADVYTVAAPDAPTVTSVQPTCTTTTGSITITNATQGLTYSINGTTYQTAAIFTNVAPGTYAVTARNGSGCTSTATSVTINAAPAAPAAPTVTLVQPTCALAWGTITVATPTGAGLTYSINGQSYSQSPVFANLDPGTYSVTVRNAAGCTSAITSVTINAAPATPVAPTVATVQPTCAVATGTITVSAPTGTGLTYSINGTTYLATATFTGVAPGTYSVRVRNAAGCTSTATSVTINAAPATPATPTATTIQPTCALAWGTITVTAPTGTGLTYSINGQSYSQSPVFANLDPGTYSVTVRNAAGCTSTATSVTINAAPTAPAAPTATTIQPTCALAWGTITVTAPTGTGLTYSINGQSYSQSPVFANLDPGTYSVTVRNAAGCTSTATSVTINTAPTAPAAATATTVQPTCAVATGTITVTAPTGTGLTYSINGQSYSQSPVFANLTPGTYSVTVRNAAGCTSTATSVTINAAPTVPAAVTATTIQPTCALAWGTITVTAPTGTGLTYSINGQSYSQSPVFANLDPGTYSVTVRNAAGCTSVATSVTINAAPTAPAAPTATTVQPTCALAFGTITVTAPTGTGLTYSINGQSYSQSPVFANLDPGTYSVTVRNAAGCTSTATSVTINTVTLPAAPLADAQIFCGATTVADLVANGTEVKWYASATATTPLATSVSLETGVYFASQTVNGCESTRTWVDVVVNTISLPTAEATQVIIAETAQDATIEDLLAEGSNLQWYASPDAVAVGTPMLQGTQLVNGATYYVTQTVNGCESAYVAVTVELVLNTDVKQGIKFTYYPNPVKDRLHIISGTTISLVEVYNLQGQKVISQPWNTATGDLNMVQLEEANYLVRVYAENNTQSFMVSKGH